MKKLLLLFVLFLTGCTEKESLQESLGLEGMDAKELLAYVEAGNELPDSVFISVKDDVLLLIEGETEEQLAMPENEFYLSVAPYRTFTHPCEIHSATNCQGELIDETFQITFVSNNGEVYFDQAVNTGANGFMDLWLPRDVEGTLTVTQGSSTASTQINTFSGSGTCLTTLELK